MSKQQTSTELETLLKSKQEQLKELESSRGYKNQDPSTMDQIHALNSAIYKTNYALCAQKIRDKENSFLIPREVVQLRRDKLEEMKAHFDELLFETKGDERHPKYYRINRTKGFIIALEWILVQDEVYQIKQAPDK